MTDQPVSRGNDDLVRAVYDTLRDLQRRDAAHLSDEELAAMTALAEERGYPRPLTGTEACTDCPHTFKDHCSSGCMGRGTSGRAYFCECPEFRDEHTPLPWWRADQEGE